MSLVIEMPRNVFRVEPGYQPMLRELGLDAGAVFDHPEIMVWRSIKERENCTLDTTMADGRRTRLHIKRYAPARGAPADEEAEGVSALRDAGIATVPLVGWGRLIDGRSFLITEDLGGYEPADKAIERGLAFERILKPTAALAATLHQRGLHHRDLYLCHFFVKTDDPANDIRLIDAARVARLPALAPLARRWIVKDAAQFWHSTLALPISDEQRERWLAAYGAARGLRSVGSLRRSIIRKARAIGRHDVKLRRRQPNRNISIPTLASDAKLP